MSTCWADARSWQPRCPSSIDYFQSQSPTAILEGEDSGEAGLAEGWEVASWVVGLEGGWAVAS